MKKAALDSLGELYIQFGPILDAFVKSKATATSLKSIDKVFAETKYDPSAGSVERKMRCITLSISNTTSSGSSGKQVSVLSVPATNLVSLLKNDCTSRIATTDGKNAWKIRKESMEEVIQEANKCCGLLSTDAKSYVNLKELMIALRSRMNDSQSNLKPLAANAMASILCRVDEQSQAKFGKAVFPSLVTASMTDMKKTMRDTSLLALKAGTMRSDHNGGGVNTLAFDALVVSLKSELSDAAIKSTGLPEVLAFLADLIQTMPDQSERPSISSRLQLSSIIVESLLSSKGK